MHGLNNNRLLLVCSVFGKNDRSSKHCEYCPQVAEDKNGENLRMPMHGRHACTDPHPPRLPSKTKMKTRHSTIIPMEITTAIKRTKRINGKPDVGLEPTTLRLRVSRATDCASRACCCLLDERNAKWCFYNVSNR